MCFKVDGFKIIIIVNKLTGRKLFKFWAKI